MHGARNKNQITRHSSVHRLNERPLTRQLHSLHGAAPPCLFHQSPPVYNKDLTTTHSYLPTTSRNPFMHRCEPDDQLSAAKNSNLEIRQIVHHSSPDDVLWWKLNKNYFS